MSHLTEEDIKKTSNGTSNGLSSFELANINKNQSSLTKNKENWNLTKE